MRKIIFLILFGLLSIPMFTQSVFNFGVRGGYNSSKITTNVKDIVNNTFDGYQMGLFVRVGGKIHFQPEVYVSTRGGELDIHYEDDLVVTKKITLNTIEVPLLVGSKLINRKKFNFRVQAGPSVSFIVDKDVYFTEELDFPNSQDLESELLDELWGFKFGAGFDILFITLDVRYDIGINNFYNKAAPSDFNINRYRNNVFLMSLGIKLINL